MGRVRGGEGGLMRVEEKQEEAEEGEVIRRGVISSYFNLFQLISSYLQTLTQEEEGHTRRPKVADNSDTMRGILFLTY